MSGSGSDWSWRCGLSVSSQEQDPAPQRAEPVAAQGPRGLLRGGSANDVPGGRWIVVAVVATALLAGAWWITRSPVFAARRVDVTGTSHLTRGAVIRLADVHHGTNVFWLNTGAVRRRLERDPWIASAQVSRSLPSTITIRIDERRLAAVMADGSGYRIVASDGTILGRAATPGSYPELVIDPSRDASL